MNEVSCTDKSGSDSDSAHSYKPEKSDYESADSATKSAESADELESEIGTSKKRIVPRALHLVSSESDDEEEEPNIVSKRMSSFSSDEESQLDHEQLQRAISDDSDGLVIQRKRSHPSHAPVVVVSESNRTSEPKEKEEESLGRGKRKKIPVVRHKAHSTVAQDNVHLNDTDSVGGDDHVFDLMMEMILTSNDSKFAAYVTDTFINCTEAGKVQGWRKTIGVLAANPDMYLTYDGDSISLRKCAFCQSIKLCGYQMHATAPTLYMGSTCVRRFRVLQRVYEIWRQLAAVTLAYQFQKTNRSDLADETISAVRILAGELPTLT